MAKTKSSKSTSASGADTPQSFEFQAEVSKLLRLMVHSVYSETEIFLRELISNAADACDKLRYEAIADAKLLGDDPDLAITITPDAEAKTLTVADNGVGMNHDELVENLGTIARSGTEAFLKQMEGKEGGVQLIGQFGVGFYSAFMVSEKVEVLTRRAGSDAAWKWTSDGSGSFTVEPMPADDAGAPQRGTVIVLHLKDDEAEYTTADRLRGIVKTYSDHISFPILLAGTPSGGEGEEADDSEQRLNAASALWTRPKSEIEAAQYNEFYAHVGGLFDEPALTLHYKAEGRHEYTVLVFVPSQRPFDLFEPERRGRLKLYVKRVFITDEADILPGYLRFVRGVIDSEDMPLNISREMLQNNPIVASIRKAVSNRVLSELEKTADKDAETFTNLWDAFGAVIKEGLYEDFERRDQLLALARFKTTESGGNWRSLKDYVEAMKENQTAIFYVTADSQDKALASPQLEGFRAKGVEVLLLTDPVDNFWITSVLGFDGKPFKSATQGGAELAEIAGGDADDDSKSDDADATEFGTLIAAIKQSLGEAVSDVRKSDRLRESAVCLVAEAGGLDRNLEKLLAQHRPDDMPSNSPVLEINPSHAMIKALAKTAKADGTTPQLEDAAQLLLDQAYILEGDPVTDPAGFAARLSRVLERAIPS
jgi:molecular chaperone HtpG